MLGTTPLLPQYQFFEVRAAAEILQPPLARAEGLLEFVRAANQAHQFRQTRPLLVIR